MEENDSSGSADSVVVHTLPATSAVIDKLKDLQLFS